MDALRFLLHQYQSSQIRDRRDKFYKQSFSKDINEIDCYFEDVDNNIKEVFFDISEIAEAKNNRVSIELLKYYMQNVIYKYIGFKNESFYKLLDNNLIIKQLEEDKDKYNYNFYNDLEEIEIMLIYTLKKYYQIIDDLGKEEDLRELQAIYVLRFTFITRKI